MPHLRSKPRGTGLVIALALISTPLPARAQCMLANPSFEIPGGGAQFAGWSQFGTVGSTLGAPHGAIAARVVGPNLGGFDVSGYWQALETAPGQRWSARVMVMVSPSSPLVGQSKAIVNVEWRSAGGTLISYESHPVADAMTSPGAWHQASIETQPAPAGTASARLLLGVLQGPGDATPQVSYDAATFEGLGPPTLESLQWIDFPSGRTIDWSGRAWRVKGTGFYGPGPNLFDHSTSAVWVDASARLHLTIRKIGSSWYSSEVALMDTLGYGDYVFTTRGRVDALDRNAVLGMFLWEYGPCYDEANLWWNPHNEIDVEFSRWGSASGPNAQFVAQPAWVSGNLHSFTVTMADDEVTTHAMRWLPDRVEFRSWRGGPQAESPGTLIRSWTYSGAQLPRPDRPRVHLNLWHISAPAVSQEVVFDAFSFVACPGGTCGSVDVPPGDAPEVGFARAWPNPFREATTIRFTTAAPGPAAVVVFDVAGRSVRRLTHEHTSAGANEFHWDGRTDDGSRVAPGVFFYRLSAPGLARDGRVVLLP